MKELEVGFVRHFDNVKKFGFIRTYYGGDIFFHISNTYETSIKIGDIVGYIIQQSEKKPEKYEAAEIRLAKNYTDEFRAARGGYTGYQWGMIMKGNDVLLSEFLNSGLNGKNELLKNVENHVESLDIASLIGSYQIIVSSGGRNKPGDDDTAWVDICSDWTYDTYNWEKLSEYSNDIYIHQLLPTVNKGIYRESAFYPWRKMIAEYKEDKENWEMLEKEALQLELEIKENARSKYNKTEHITILKEHLEKEINIVQQKHLLSLKHFISNWKYDEIITPANDA